MRILIRDPTTSQVSASHNHIMLAGGIDPWIYSHVGGVRLPTTRTALGFGRGFGFLPPHHVDLGVEAVVAERVGACNTSVAVPGGRVSFAWRHYSLTTTGSTDTAEATASHARLECTAVIPLGYAGRITVPRAISGHPVTLLTLRASGTSGNTTVTPAHGNGASCGGLSWNVSAGVTEIVAYY